MNKTKIDWTDMSWNPVTGCLHECSFCYAHAIYHRFGRSFEPAFHPERLAQPLKVSKPQKVFVCSVADLFGEWVPVKWINEVLNIVEQCPQHTFQFLTKDPRRLSEIDFPDNCWVGVTANTQKMFDNACKYLDNVTATVRFISAEPLHSAIIFDVRPPIDWLIVGAQTGIKKIQPEKIWVDNIITLSNKFHIPLFFKENLKYKPFFTEWPKAIKKQLALV